MTLAEVNERVNCVKQTWKTFQDDRVVSELCAPLVS